MPLKRTIRRRKPVKRFRRRKGTRAIAKRAERGVKTLARTREVKYYNKTIANTQFSPTGTVLPLTDIDQGDTAITRDGNMISVRSVKILGTFTTALQPDNIDPGTIRTIIFQDKQQVADGTPAVGDILKSPSLPYSVYNYPSIRNRFKILYDRHQALNVVSAYGDTSGVQHATTFKRWIFPTAKNVMYNGTASGDIQKNGLYMLLSGSNDANTYEFQTQLAYTDS